jgi:hypothetical protein
MIGTRVILTGAGIVTAGLLLAGPALTQVQIRPQRRPEVIARPPADGTVPLPVRPPTPGGPGVIAPEAVAETKLIMEGMTDPNFRGVQRQLKEEPANVETWTFVRGQALLVAESGNLLMLRPPNNAGAQSWQEMAVAERLAATRLARAAGSRDYVKSRVALADLTNACNRCHKAFRVEARLDPLPAEK